MKEFTGNIVVLAFQGKFDAIVQGCNCQMTMGAGLALEIKNKIPSAYQADIDYSLKMKYELGLPNINKLGTLSIATIHQYTDANNQTTMTSEFDVVNAYTQNMPGPDLSYEALVLCLQKINKVYKGKKIAFPMIGCGIAGGDWTLVKPMIKKYVADCDVNIVYFNK